MSFRNRYATGSRRLHWVVVAMMLVVYVAMTQRVWFERGTFERTAMMQVHYWLGLGIFALVWWRLRLRMRHAEPSITPALPRWQAVASKVMHLALYAFMIVMPILGLTMIMFEHRELYVPFTGIVIPSPLPLDEAMAKRLEELHVTIGEAFYYVFGLHVLAALYHHFWRRDDTLKRML